jgi:hypothetical protein
LSYFLRNPSAADNLEGIVKFRLLEERVHRAAEQTREAIEWLVARGLLDESEITPGKLVFSLNKQRLEETQRLMETMKTDLQCRRGHGPA